MDTEPIVQAIEQILTDRGVPKNIKSSCDECLRALKDEKEDLSVRLNTCISVLDEVSNDPNIPMHTRTFVWNIVSMLEAAQHA
ncbi:MAG: UPF0147 family protein [Candidatus Aenigmatarchaeota archaeon]|nr:MAG: UPF0147 family protein [Candidatus Aenigmarchaeota archaeon]